MTCGKLKILHIITSLRAGGAERLVADILIRLKDRGYDTALMIFDGTRTPLYDELEGAGIKIYYCGVGFYQMWNPLHVFKIRRLLRDNKYDIVHTHNTPAQLLTVLAGAYKYSALVTTEHNTFNRRRAKGWYRRIDRWMYGKYASIICVGRQTQVNLIESLDEKSLSERICVIPNGIDLKKFGSTISEDAAPRDNDGEHIVLMVAGFRKQKDQPALIRAMRRLPENYKLWLAGDGLTRQECEQLAESLGLTNRVEFLGVRSDIPELISRADLFVLSSYYEGFGLSVVEAMALGKAVIASDVDGLREVVGGAGLLFRRGDDEELAGLIKKLCEDKELNRSVAERCAERAGCFDIENTVTEYEKIYDIA